MEVPIGNVPEVTQCQGMFVVFFNPLGLGEGES